MTTETIFRRRRVALTVAAVLAAGPAYAAPGERTIVDVAAAEARRAGAAPPAPSMRPGLKWTGIALVLAGAASIADGAQGCHTNSGICKGRRQWQRRIGYVSGAAGVTLLVIGAATRRDRRTSIDVDGSRVIAAHRLSF